MAPATKEIVVARSAVQNIITAATMELIFLFPPIQEVIAVVAI